MKTNASNRVNITVWQLSRCPEKRKMILIKQHINKLNSPSIDRILLELRVKWQGRE